MEQRGPDFVPTSLQLELTQAASQFLRSSIEVSPAHPETLAGDKLWKQIGAELGWVELMIPEEHGGLGGSLADLTVVLEQAGRVLLGVPLADTALCAWAVAELLPASGKEALLSQLRTGERIGALAFDAPILAERTESALALHGEASGVPHGAEADMLLLWCLVDESPVLLLLTDATLEEASRRHLETADPTRPVAHVAFDSVEVAASDALASGAEAARLHEVWRARRAVALSAESVGGADEALAMAVAYAREREQFGRPIGSFQAIKHKLADVLILVEQARTMVRCAASWPENDPKGFLYHAAMAKAHADRAFRHATAEAIQTHGGIGFTWEHPAHLYYKRAAINAQLVWPATACREWVRRALFD